MADARHVNAQILIHAGATVGDALDRAAQPVQVPTATPGSSPADAAASAVAAAMHGKVSANAAELAPQGPKVRQASSAAAAKLTATDEQNAARIGAIPTTMTQSAADATAPDAAASAAAGSTGGSGAGRIEQVSDGWDDPAEPWRIGPDFWEDEFGHFHPPVEEPIDPGGAAGGGGGAGRAPI